MGLFGRNKKSFVGVDLGGGGIKLVELLREQSRTRLFTYGFTEREPGSEPLNIVDDVKAAGALLKQIMQKSSASQARAVAGLPISSVFSAVISVPRASEKEMKESMNYQAKKLIPVPLEEMVLDFRPINSQGKSDKPEVAKPDVKSETAAKPQSADKNVQVLITGASRTMVQKYVNVFRTAGVQLESLETEAFGLIRSLIGKDRSTNMIVDIGAIRTNIIIVEKGIPYVTRSLDMGGVTLTKAMSKALSIDMIQAEKMKRDIRGLQSIYEGDALPKIFAGTIAPLITELRYSISLYSSQQELHSATSVEKIILTGGSAALPALVNHVGKELGIRTYVGDPWARVAHAEELRSVLDEIGPRFAVSIGLAMRDME